MRIGLACGGQPRACWNWSEPCSSPRQRVSTGATPSPRRPSTVQSRYADGWQRGGTQRADRCPRSDRKSFVHSVIERYPVARRKGDCTPPPRASTYSSASGRRLHDQQANFASAADFGPGTPGPRSRRHARREIQQWLDVGSWLARKSPATCAARRPEATVEILFLSVITPWRADHQAVSPGRSLARRPGPERQSRRRATTRSLPSPSQESPRRFWQRSQEPPDFLA